MPYAEDFDAAAAALESAAESTATLLEPARAVMAGDVMVGGALSAVVADELDAAASLMQGVGTELGRLAATCRERAEISRQALAAGQAYDSEYAAYEAALRDLPADVPAPAPPTPPPAAPPWADL